MVLERPDTYIERREDGYQEPQTIFLIGTAHVSQRSAEDVHRVAAAVQPDAVVVELCRSRQAVMYPVAAQQQQELQTAAGEAGAGSPGAALMSAGAGSSSDEAEQPRSSSSSTGTSSSSSSSSNSTSGGKGSNPLSLSGGGGLLPDFQRSLELGGASALMLRLVLGRLSAGMSGGLGVVGGAEFVAARQEAEARGAQVSSSWLPPPAAVAAAVLSPAWGREGLTGGRAGPGASCSRQPHSLHSLLPPALVALPCPAACAGGSPDRDHAAAGVGGADLAPAGPAGGGAGRRRDERPAGAPCRAMPCHAPHAPELEQLT